MTTINTIEDLIRLLDENPEWLEAVRSRVLSRELVELPERFTRFEERMDAFVETTNSFITEMKVFVETTNSFIAEMKVFVETTNSFIAEMKVFVETTNRRFDRIDADIGNLKGLFARRDVIDDCSIIGRQMGLRRTRVLSRDDLWDMTDDSAVVAGISSDDLRSFRRADLIMEAVDQEGETRYIAVEISFTVNGRDTTRAVRNAEFMTRFTGRHSHAAVAGMNRDYRFRDITDSGEVFWYQLDPAILEPD